MTNTGHPRACPCPARVVDAAVVLLGSGRAGMALDLLRPLAGRLRDAREVLEDVAAARAELGRLRAEADALRLANGVLCREIDRAHRDLALLEDPAAASTGEPPP